PGRPGHANRRPLSGRLAGGRGRQQTQFGDSEGPICAKLPTPQHDGWGRRENGERHNGISVTPGPGTVNYAFAEFNAAPNERPVQRDAAGEGTGTAVGAGDYAITADDAFTWRSGGAEVTLAWASDGWIVSYSAAGRLLGPPQLLHQARHRDARHAAWDVMAR